jgi:predicted nucleic acid-binding Zn ribbon protein
MELTGDEKTLLIAGLGYLAVTTLWVLTIHARGKLMLRALGELIEPDLWQALGAPTSLQAAMKDPQRRWHRFVRNGEYRRVCSDEIIALIDDYRSRTKRMLLILGGAGLLLLVRFWPLLKPSF